jgi:hypothetical protein
MTASPAAHQRFRGTCLLASATGALAAALAPAPPWPLALAGAIAVAAIASALALGADELPARGAVAAAAALGLLASCAALWLIPPLESALEMALPAALARALAGGVLGCWIGAASAPLHLQRAGDPIEARFATLRPLLSPELRELAERALQARRSVVAQGPGALQGEVRETMDGLVSAALDLARLHELARASGATAPSTRA